ncbi:MAG: hypothetical protein ACI32N_02925 [Bulleidia sp.]
MNKKVIATVGACALCLGLGVAGTLAWLTDKTDPVVNTFTDSDINITLTETKNDFQMIPGFTIDKDPTVTVDSGSEDCYLFVKLDKSETYGTYLEDYVIADGWTALDTTAYPGVYYRTVLSADSVRSFSVLKDNQVTVKTSVTKEDMDAIDGVVSVNLSAEEKTKAIDAELAKRPTLTVTAYATQYYQKNNTPFSAQTAWTNINPSAGTGE